MMMTFRVKSSESNFDRGHDYVTPIRVCGHGWNAIKRVTHLLSTIHHRVHCTMPAQRIAQPNPPPDPSHLPDSVLDYRARASTGSVITPAEMTSLRKFTRAANYIAAGN